MVYKTILALFLSISVVGCTQQMNGTQIRLAAEACGGVEYLDSVSKTDHFGDMRAYCTNGQSIEMKQWEVLK